MKYLKTFENIKKFKIGDYVVAKELPYSGYIKEYMENTVAIIINIDSSNDIHIRYNNIPKEAEYFCNDDDDFFIDFFSERELRFATLKEIEDYEIKENLKKYNI